MQGEFDRAVEIKRDDEIGQLAESLNKMTTNLKKITAPGDDLNREIIERKNAEKALKESEPRFKFVIGEPPITVFYQDENLRYTWVYSPNPNPGLTPEQVVNKTDEDLLPPEDAAHLMEMKRRVLESGVKARDDSVYSRSSAVFVRTQPGADN